MMGSGKTTVGEILATQLGYRFFDTDSVIEKVAGRSVAEIFATAGEAEFRQLETQVLAELSAYTKLVIATGGGIVLQRQNWSHLRHGLIIWLDVPVEQLYDRLQGDMVRPLLQDADPLQKLTTLLDQRQILYAQADVPVRVEMGESAEQVASRILEEIPKVLKPDIHPIATSE
ncbi:MAG: shikimate kinase [Cyanobacteria bacterium CRU_2_1]|nr:shikimate kinase [Cyanobacteria bacterium RU_5_0]NJR61395.1 shikimate kinase [Cyanobacteria bacterium CRU_2_1]